MPSPATGFVSLKALLDELRNLRRLDFLQFGGDEEGGEADQLQAVALQRLDREEAVEQAETKAHSWKGSSSQD